jgi:hypothetical protein
MRGCAVRVTKASVCASLLAAVLPWAAHATEVTFDWVPIVENPASAQTTTASGSITINFSSWGTVNPDDPPNYGPYYTTGSAITGTITAFSYTSADGITVGLSNLSTTTIGAPTTQAAQIWSTSSIDTPATGAQAPSPPTAGYYLITAFSVSGDTAQDTPFMISNNTGDAGATFANGIGNADTTFNADGSIPGIENGGYWEVVPLPAGLPLLLSGLGLMGWLLRRRPAQLNLAS